jgi:outer membrane protein W
MTYRRILCGVAVVLLTVVSAEPVAAQRPGEWATSLAYSPVMGLGETKDFIDGLSWRGMTLDFEKGVTDSFTIGGSAGWHVLADESSGTSKFEGGAATGTAFRYMNSVPLLLTANYFAGRAGTTRPFIGIGAGTFWVENRTDAGVFFSEESNWHPGLMGEAGVSIQREDGTMTLSARYNYARETNDVEHTYLTFSVGFTMAN